MMNLKGKNILICRGEKESARFKSYFKNEGVLVHFFPTYRTEFVSSSAADRAIATLQNAAAFDWIVFSSKNGVKAAAYFLQLTNKSERDLALSNLAVVGKSTVQKLSTTFLSLHIKLEGKNLQSLLEQIDRNSAETSLNVLHITSEQSLEKLAPTIPNRIKLKRVPFYRTVMNDSISAQKITDLKDRKFDAIVFTSPTSFDYFLKLMNGDDALIRSSAIATLGKTTGHYLEKSGYLVDITPDRPSAAALIESVKQYFIMETDPEVS